MSKDEHFMRIALNQAAIAFEKGDVPVGCVIVQNDVVIVKSYNKRHNTKNSLDHAELIAIKKACKKLNAWILEDCDIYVTLEPCLMCAGAILQSRFKRLIYAANEPKFGSCGSIINVIENNLFNHQVQITKGVLKEESSELIRIFFKKLRVSKNKVGVESESTN